MHKLACIYACFLSLSYTHTIPNNSHSLYVESTFNWHQLNNRFSHHLDLSDEDVGCLSSPGVSPVPFLRHHHSHINLHHHELVFYVLVFDSSDLTGCTLLYQPFLPSPMLLEVDIICSFYCCKASISFTLNYFSLGGHVRWLHFRVGSYCHQLSVSSQVEPPQAITIGQTSSSSQNKGSCHTNDLGCVYSSNAEVLQDKLFL